MIEEINVLSSSELDKMDKYFRAVNYLSVGQLYLLDNPLLREPLRIEHIKPYVVGHWGTIPGQNFVYMHLNRVIKKDNLNMLFISGPGHGGQVAVTNSYFDGSYSEIYPHITQDMTGLKKLCKQFSFPGGISSHAAPETPGSINEGGELGYSLSHAYGAVLDNPDLIVACVIGDGEAETGPLAGSWFANKLINPETDGAVLPILHLNEFKIANPTILSRIGDSELISYFKGNGYMPFIVDYSTSTNIHETMAKAMDTCITLIKTIWKNSRENNSDKRPTWPMIILKTPKGWTGPKFVDEKEIEGTFRAHQVPIQVDKDHIENLELLEDWLRSYNIENLFDDNGRLIEELRELTPKDDFRIGLNKHANGGGLLKPLIKPNVSHYAVEIEAPGNTIAEDMKILGNYIKDLISLNEKTSNYRIFGPDELASNRLYATLDVTKRQWMGDIKLNDDGLAKNGRIIDSVLSEHLCQGLLEGYLLTGRHGFMHSYEAFIRIIDSMTSQHAKWLKVTSQLPWRHKISSLNYILSSHIWQQDHNGYTHQNPGFINHVLSLKPEFTRVYLPADANSLLCCYDKTINTKNLINVIVASKHSRPQWLNMKEAIKHCNKGIGIWDFAGNATGEKVDLVMACAGDTPTLETIAAVKILNEKLPELKVRVINVVDLMTLHSKEDHPNGLYDFEYNSLFTKDKPIVFAFHGYREVIKQLTYSRVNKNMNIHGYLEEGTITTGFDMRVQNKLDRFNLIISALEKLNLDDNKASLLYDWCKNKLIEHKEYIHEIGIDMPEIKNWKFND
ncbi:MAG: phosphoketolase [Bacilli bacterium]